MGKDLLHTLVLSKCFQVVQLCFAFQSAEHLVLQIWGHIHRNRDRQAVTSFAMFCQNLNH